MRAEDLPGDKILTPTELGELHASAARMNELLPKARQLINCALFKGHDCVELPTDVSSKARDRLTVTLGWNTVADTLRDELIRSGYREARWVWKTCSVTDTCAIRWLWNATIGRPPL